MKVVYLAGRYRDARGHYYVTKNIELARDIALELWRLGYAVICPHMNTAHLDGAAPDDVWLRGDIELLKRSDIVVMIPGWEQSKGAQDEEQIAEVLKKRIYYWETARPPAEDIWGTKPTGDPT